MPIYTYAGQTMKLRSPFQFSGSSKNNFSEINAELIRRMVECLIKQELESEKTEGLNVKEVFEHEIIDPENVGISPIDKLPYDCLEKIFRYLPVEDRLKTSQVCMKWNEASAFIWANVTTLEYESKWPTCIKQQDEVSCDCYMPLCDLKLKFYYIPNLFVLCGRYVKELDISQFSNSIILTAVKGNFPNLVKLTIFMREWKEKHIQNLFTGMAKLEWLHIKWNHCKVIPLVFFDALNDVVDTLKELRLWSTEIHIEPDIDFKTYHLEDSALLTLRRLQLLETLILFGVRMNENTVEAISQLKNLNQLLLLDCCFTSVSMMFPLLNLINLEILEPGFCLENCDSFLKKIPDKLKKLVDLRINVRIATDDGVLPLTKLESLKCIAVDNYSKSLEITDFSIGQFKNIHKIHLKNVPMVTDDSITRIIKSSPSLEYIDLRISGITFDTVQLIIDTMKTRTNHLVALIDLPDDHSKLPENLPNNLELEVNSVSE